RIHILGLGNLGRVYAHALATAPDPPSITLLFHRKSLLQEWAEADASIEIEGISKFLPGIPSSSSGYDVEVLDTPSTKNSKPIQHLIIATKAQHTLKAFDSIANRLNHNSTILFTQNGLGTIEEVTEKYYDHSTSHPSYLAAVTSHGVYSTAPFRSVFAGWANVTIGHVSLPRHVPPPIGAQYFLDKITSAPPLNAQAVSPKELKILQLRKLVVNATINPLSVVFRRKNGDLFNHEPIYALMRIMVLDISEFLRDHQKSIFDEHGPFHDGKDYTTALPFSLNLNLSEKEFEEHFSVKSLESLVLSVAEKTAQNTSSMLQDVEAGRDTEIDYINGWFTR
ncbi:ApbA-domain-containing protein, partial [Acephala macrosclerotiorum]